MKPLSKKSWNTIVDLLAYAAFVVLTMTGIIMHYILPPGSGHRLSIWGLGRHEWGEIHFWTAVAFFGVLALHLFLHWKWIISILKGTPRNASQSRFLIGSIGLIAILLISLTPLLSPVESNANGGREGESTESHEEHGAQTISGSMTIGEISEAYDIPAEEIISFLGLPENTDRSAKLGQLKREYEFDMHTLREFVENREE